MFQDLRYALRQMWKSPGFTAVAILTLALGIGANTAIFTLLDQALLRTLPVSHPERLVRLRYVGSNSGRINAFGGDGRDYFSYPMYRDLRDKNQVLAGLLADNELQVGVQWNNQPDLASGELVCGNYFDVLGIRPAFGRFWCPPTTLSRTAIPWSCSALTTGVPTSARTRESWDKCCTSTIIPSPSWALRSKFSQRDSGLHPEAVCSDGYQGHCHAGGE